MSGEPTPAGGGAAASRVTREPCGDEAVSLYVHVPFCASRCAYCDFETRALDAGDSGAAAIFDEYVGRTLDEVSRWRATGFLADVPTLYVGGGTPTLLGARLATLVGALRESVGLRADAEVTIEANPDSLDAALLGELLAAGVNRVSLGVQSFDDEVLAALGRRHDAASARRAAALLRDAGVRFSVDLICGVPGQSTESWRASVRDAIAAGAGHVSVYPLTVEDGTPLGRAVECGDVPDVDPDAAAEQLLEAARLLGQAGIARYEVANHARPGRESRHNTRYWTGGAYVGVGPSAASMLPAALARAAGIECDADAARVRFVDGGAPGAGPREFEQLTADEALREDAMLGLRLVRGISGALADAAGVAGVLEELRTAGLVECAESDDGPRWRTTERGWLLGNEVYSRVWAGT